jgi:anaerobic ribonucleoside-triphosphate reductase activating protein
VADVFLNVSAVRRRTRVNGPGLRNAIWVQGCTLRCPGCFNPDTHPHEARTLHDPELLARRLFPETDVEGISLLGGEPFEQAAACARLAEVAKGAGASVVTYSGYTWKFLRESRLPEVGALLAVTDLLVAGPFVEARRTDGAAWHGSDNQELVLLSDRYDARDLDGAHALHRVEVRTDGRRLSWTGIPQQGDEL